MVKKDDYYCNCNYRCTGPGTVFLSRRILSLVYFGNHTIVLLFSVAILVLTLTFKNSEVTTVAGGIYATDNLHNSGGGASRARRIKATRYGGE